MRLSTDERFSSVKGIHKIPLDKYKIFIVAVKFAARSSTDSIAEHRFVINHLPCE